jgi:hypothetical protein
LLKVLYKKEPKTQHLRGETLKIYRALAAFYKATIIPMVRWSFCRAGFSLNPENLLAPVRVRPDEVLGRIALPEITLEELTSLEPNGTAASARPPVRRRARIPGPVEFAVNLKAYVDKVGGVCPLCGHKDQVEATEDEQKAKE